MATSIGKLQVDFIANVAKFVEGVKKAWETVEKWGKKVDEVLRHMEQGLKSIGEKMTKWVTLPLTALAAAAIKAADPAGEFAKEMKTLGVEALLALEPLGKVLISLIREAEPAIRVGIGLVRTLFEEFANLEPATQRMVVVMGAVAAAIGPVALVGAGLIAVFNALTPAIVAMVSWSWKLAVLSVPFIKLGLAIGAIGAAFYMAAKAGQTLYEQSKGLQITMANMIESFTELFALIRREIQLVLADVVSVMTKLPDGLLSFIGGINPSMNGLATAASALKALGKDAANTSRIWAEYSETVQRAAEINKASIASIEDDFAKNPTRKSFGDLVAEDLEAMKRAIAGVTPNFDGLMARAKAWADVSPEMAKMWQKLAEDAKRSADRLEESFGSKVENRIKGFASSVGDTFADLALEGENNFKALAKSFERMLVSMFATQLLFQPLFDAIGGYVGARVGNSSWGGGGSGSTGAGGAAGLPGYDLSNEFRMGGTGGVTVNVIDQRSGGSPVEVQDRTGPNGRTIDLLIKDSVKKLLRSGELDRDMRIAYGAGRSGRV